MKEFTRGKGKLKKKILSVLALACLTLSVAFVMLIGLLQARYLALGTFDKTIEFVRFVRFEEEPFQSGIAEDRFFEDKELLNVFQSELNTQDIAIGPCKPTSNILFIHFSDGSELIAYLYEEGVGLDFGRIKMNVRSVEYFK